VKPLSLVLTAKKVYKETPEAGFKPDGLSGALFPDRFILKMQNSLRSNSCIFLTEKYILHSVLQRLREESQGDASFNVKASLLSLVSQLNKNNILKSRQYIKNLSSCIHQCVTAWLRQSICRTEWKIKIIVKKMAQFERSEFEIFR
jgi:hypothetical protein